MIVKRILLALWKISTSPGTSGGAKLIIRATEQITAIVTGFYLMIRKD